MLLIQELIDKYNEEELLRVYKNLDDKEKDFDNVEIEALTREMLQVMRNKLGRDYRLNLLYSNLAHYFANKYIMSALTKNKTSEQRKECINKGAIKFFGEEVSENLK